LTTNILHAVASSIYFPVAESKNNTSENPLAFASVVEVYTYTARNVHNEE
jgi:hypothetical protein